MITNVVVTNRHDASRVVFGLQKQGNSVCWITISDKRASPLVLKSNKHTLVCKFDDISINPVTKNQVRKIKNFIMNHHVNRVKDYVLVVNCHAGVSRSAAVGMFCKHNLGVPVQFRQDIFPNRVIMQALGVVAKHWVTVVGVGVWD